MPDLVLFPHALLPLHIFEPRYRDLTEDALAGDRLVTMVQIRPAAEGSPWTEPVPIMEIGCLGKIVRFERLSDGRFNFILLGCSRVRLVREIPSAKPYRIAEAELMEDRESDRPPEPRRAELAGLFRELLERRERLNDDLSAFLSTAVPLGVLSDIIAHALGVPPDIKQALLAETDVDVRVDTVRAILHRLIDQDQPSRPFPPLFSPN